MISYKCPKGRREASYAEMIPDRNEGLWFVLALRRDMSIKAVAERTEFHWETVKKLEKKWLKKKYKRTRHQ